MTNGADEWGGRMERKWANLVKSLCDAAHFAAGHRCEPLEVVDTAARFAPCQRQNGLRRRRNPKCKQALIHRKEQKIRLSNSTTLFESLNGFFQSRIEDKIVYEVQQDIYFASNNIF
jgi:hypothetical protein